MNSCNFVGRLGKAPELRRTDKGTAVCSFSLAVNRPRVKDTTDWIEFVAWQQSAEYLCKYGNKGDIVAAVGSLQPRKWTDKDGNERTAFEIVVSALELIPKTKREETGNTTQPQNTAAGGYSTPQYSGQMPPQYNQQGFDGYQQPAFQGQMYQPPQGQFAPIEDDGPLPF